MNGTQLRAKFDTEWGMFRKFIASNPLTGFWIGMVAGGMIVGVVGRIL